MTAPFTPRLDILPPSQRDLWPALGPTIGLGFVLYGGTAIALRLGHRISIDFDFFNNGSLDRRAIAAALPFMAKADVLQDQPDTLTVLVSGDDRQVAPVKLSF